VTQARNVLISGAGIAGPTLAYWLLRDGFTPTIVERAPTLRTDGYMIDFWGVGYDVAERMGILPDINRDGYRIEQLELVDASGQCITTVDAHVFQAASNGRFLSLLRGDLARRIYNCIDARVETIFGDTIATLNQDADGVDITFEHAAPRRFDLVIGADGLHSNVRTLAFDDATPAGAVNNHSDPHEYPLGYYAAAFIAASYPHRTENAYVSYTVPGRQVARYALRDGSSAFLFVFTENKQLALAHHDVQSQQRILSDKFSGAGWECDEILAAMQHSDSLYFDAVAQIRIDSWSRGRVALLGDAAYCPSLLAGQGSALAMAGAYVLARSVSSNKDDYAAGFAEYQRRFKPFVDAKQRSAAGFGSWFAPRTRAGVWMRNAATKLMRIPYLADMLAKQSFSDHFELDRATGTE
jgi:2-polyprenyl-6-methoxyphenol hydroxylase-like FAD-dependent oxidoreductase